MYEKEVPVCVFFSLKETFTDDSGYIAPNNRIPMDTEFKKSMENAHVV
jgi:hypothetical protein